MKFISLFTSYIAVTQAQNFLDADLDTLELDDSHRKLAPVQRDFRQAAPDYREITFDMDWYIMDDRVMGGSSYSYITEEDDFMSYYGTLVSDGGGFVSTRTQTFNFYLNLSNYKGIQISVKSDSNLIYKFGMKDQGRSDRYSIAW